MAPDKTPGFTTEEVSLTAEGLSGGAPPLRFAHLSDLHLRTLGKRHERLVEELRRRRPEFLCVTGDFLTRAPESMELCRRLFSRLQCPQGIFACPGNGETKRGIRYGTLQREMESWGARLLVNRSELVGTEGGMVRVAGIDDLATGWPNLREALVQPECPPADFNVLLSHAPLAADMIGPQHGVDLMLSGHTHGGQIRVPLVWGLMLPSAHGGYIAGLYRQQWGDLYVSRGFGVAAVVPLRLGCPAEVTFFEVRGR